MIELKKFVKTSGIYMIGNVLAKAILFCMIPIYTKYISPTDYGTYDVNVAYITFLSSVLFLNIWSGILRFMFDFPDTKQRGKPILSGLIIFLFSTLLYTLFTVVLGSLMDVQYLIWVYLYGLTNNVQQLFSYIVRGYQKNTLFAASGVIGSFIAVFVNVVFIGFLHYGYQYLYIASIAGSLASILILFIGTPLRKIITKQNLSWELTRELFVFSLPLMVNSISWWFLNAFNRVIVSNRLSVADNGIYAIANRFSSIIQLVDQAFQMAWQEISFSKGSSHDQNKGTFFSRAITEYIKFMTIVIVMLLPVIKIGFPYFVGKNFVQAIYIIPLALIATLLDSISTFLGGTMTAIKKNKYLFTTTFMGTIVNVFLIFALINSFHVQAASIALGCGYLVVDIRRYFVLKRYINLRISMNLLFLLVVLLLSACMTYFIGNVLVNFVFFIVVFLLALYLYKDVIRKFLHK